MQDLISIILVHTKRSSNVGASARAMNCMGFKDLILVEPRCQIDRFAFGIATGSADVLENAKIYSSLEEAVKGYGLIIGTTRRKGKRRYNFITIDDMVKSVIPQHYHSKIALLFGPEDYGLSREHIQLCNYLVTIQTSDRFGSLNLAQAVMIVCYELMSGLSPQPELMDDEYASIEDLERMNMILEDTFIQIRFPTRKKIQHESGHLKEIIARAHLKKWELEFFLGFLRHLRYMGRTLWDE